MGLVLTDALKFSTVNVICRESDGCLPTETDGAVDGPEEEISLSSPSCSDFTCG